MKPQPLGAYYEPMLSKMYSPISEDMFTEHPNTQAFDLFLCRIQRAFIPSEFNSHKEMWRHRNKPDGLEIKGQVDDVCLKDSNSLSGLRSDLIAQRSLDWYSPFSYDLSQMSTF